MKARAFPLLSIFILLSACSGAGDDDSSRLPVLVDEQEFISGSKARQSASADDVELLVLSENNNDFSTNFYRQQLPVNSDANIIMSPLSISNAFAMLYGGSAGNTKIEIQDTLKFSQEEPVFHQAFNTLSQSLSAYENNDDFTLTLANALWGDKNYDFNATYLDQLSEFYGADIKIVDFIAEANAARERINIWVETQTNSLIKNILPENSISTDTRLVLTNAIYFNAKWLNEFDQSQTTERAFTLKSGENIQVPTMHRRGNYLSYQKNDEILVELNYKNTDWSMYVLSAPIETFASFEASLDSSKLDQMLAEASIRDVELYLPKFSFGFKIELQESLEEMGVTTAFNPLLADFSLINEREQAELFIQTAIHQAFITVDEAGTEAGATTVIGVGTTSVPPSIYFDQPFIFLIKHKPSDSNVFIGRVMNPLG